MEKNITRRFVKGLLALSAGFLLASCDPVHALPTNHAENIVVNKDDSKIDVTDNDLLQIYNLIESGQNEEVVSKILREIAENKFGKYKDLYDAVKNEQGTERAKFIADHKNYFNPNDDEFAEKRFDDFVKDIDLRISEAFYTEISSGSYNDEEGKFSEKKLYNAKRYELYDLPAAGTEVVNNKFYVTKDITKENTFRPLEGGQENKLKGVYHNFTDGERGYIEEKVYPEILKNKFVEAYIQEKNPASLGRAYARKINYVKVSYEKKSESSALWKMLKKFADLYIENGEGKMDFELIAGAIKGFTVFGDSVLVDKITADDATGDAALVNALLSEGHASETDKQKFIEVKEVNEDHYWYGDKTEADSIHLIPNGNYYRDTKLGKLIVSYEEAIKAEKNGRFATPSQVAELEKFTSEGKPKEYGLMQKIIALAKEDYTTDGWVLKNGGATELPSSIRDRLFNIKVANILDDNEAYEGHTDPALPDEAKDGKENIGKYNGKNYVRNIYGNKLVLSSEASPFKLEHYNYIHEDVDGKAFYICEVKEAPSTAKLSERSSTVYKKDGKIDTYRIEQLGRQVAKVLGTKDSYIKDAYTEMLKNYKFEFYDASLFEYINSEYPDLELDD